MLFFLNVIPGVGCVGLVLLILPDSHEAEKQSLDLAGLLTLSVFLVSILVAVSQRQREGWDAPFIHRLFVIAGVALVAFLARAFNMRGEVATPNLYAVSQQNCPQVPDTRMAVMCRRSGSSSSNNDVERAGLSRL
jgi:hypothetical protein